MELKPEEIAANLRKPEGEAGMKIGDLMNKGNANFYDQLIKNVDWKDGMNILEVGIGTALHVPQLLNQAKNISYTGVDFSETMVVAGKKNNPSQTFIQQDVLELNLQDQKFDLIVTINTVYFLEDLKKAFLNLKNCLQPNGIIHIGKRPKENMDQMDKITKFGFIKYSNEEVVKEVMGAGLDIVQVVSSKDPLDENSWSGLELHSDFIIAKHGN